MRPVVEQRRRAAPQELREPLRAARAALLDSYRAARAGVLAELLHRCGDLLTDLVRLDGMTGDVLREYGDEATGLPPLLELALKAAAREEDGDEAPPATG